MLSAGIGSNNLENNGQKKRQTVMKINTIGKNCLSKGFLNNFMK